VIREVGDRIQSAVLESVGRTVGRAQERRPLPADLLESDDAYLAVFDAPGAMQSDVQVRYDDGAILVRVDRFRRQYSGFDMQFPGRGLSLDGRVDLPEDARVDPSESTATLKDDGTLHVTVPKRDVESDDEAEKED
jgi:HSP20 family molecular chaperone IbpA